MANENNHINFTAADIERYHKGLLSAKERHALEKAALDDPFLADALEGYAVTGVNAEADIAELKKRLSERVDERKVIPILTGGRNNFRWLKAAAMIILIAGAGLLVYQFAFNNKSNDIAQLSPKKKEEAKPADSANTTPATKTPNETKDVPTTELKSKKSEPVVNDKNLAGNINKQTIEAGAIKKDSAYSGDIKNPSSEPFAAPKNEDEKKVTVTNELKKEKDDIVKDDIKNLQDKDNRRVNAATTKPNANLYSKETVANQQQENNRNANVFRGRITDANNNPVPFANITNTEDNIGTYSDAKGNFNLTSPDSVLDVQVRSIGFENNNARLRNNVINNQVVLRDDRNSLSEIVISDKKPNAAARSRDANIKVEEPEPADGWDNYDTYLVNNLKVPDEIKMKPTRGDVEISFEVDKNGDPVNIKVEKSLCGKCDKEAIRLIKDGPKWKRKDRKARTKITVPF